MADDHREWRSAQVFGDKAVTEEITDSAWRSGGAGAAVGPRGGLSRQALLR